MWNKIKEHPWIVGGIVAVFLIVLIFSSSGSSSSSAAPTATSDPNGDQLQAYLASINQQGTVASLQAGTQAQQTAAAVTVAQLQSSSTDLANQLAAQVAENQINVQGSTQQNADTLSAHVAETESNNQTLQAAYAAHAQETQINQNAATTESWISALTGLENNQISSQTQVALGQQQVQSQLVQANENVALGQVNANMFAAQANKDVQTQSFFSKIFG